MFMIEAFPQIENVNAHAGNQMAEALDTTPDTAQFGNTKGLIWGVAGALIILGILVEVTGHG